MIGTLPQPASMTKFYQTFPSFALNCGFYPAVLDKLMATAYGGTAPHPYVPLIGFERTPNQADLPLLLREPRSETSRKMREDWDELQRITGHPRRGLPADKEDRTRALEDILSSSNQFFKAGRNGRRAMFFDETRTIGNELDLTEVSEALAPYAAEAWFDLMRTETEDTAYAFFLGRALAMPLMLGTPLTEDIITHSTAYFLRQGDELEAARAFIFKAHNRFERTREPETILAISPLFEVPAGDDNDPAVTNWRTPFMDDSTAAPEPSQEGTSSADWLTIMDDINTASAFFKDKDDESAGMTANFAAMASKEASAVTKRRSR